MSTICRCCRAKSIDCEAAFTPRSAARKAATQFLLALFQNAVMILQLRDLLRRARTRKLFPHLRPMCLNSFPRCVHCVNRALPRRQRPRVLFQRVVLLPLPEGPHCFQRELKRLHKILPVPPQRRSRLRRRGHRDRHCLFERRPALLERKLLRNALAQKCFHWLLQMNAQVNGRIRPSGVGANVD